VKRLAADLHIHTALSPCAAEEMTPPAIVREALAQGLDMIAICDHNSAANCAAVQEAARGALAVLAGLEITTTEEAHVLGFFPDADRASNAGKEVCTTLPQVTSSSRLFGEQLVMNAAGETIRRETRILSTSSAFSLSEAVLLIKRHEGVAVASHVDRPSYSVISQLGVFPPDSGFDAIEISAAGRRAGRHEAFAALGLPMLVSSDSHYLSEVGAGRTCLEVQDATFHEFAMALRGADGRRCCLV